MFATVEHRAPQIAAARHCVDPGHRIGPAARGLEGLDRSLQGGRENGLLAHPSGLYRAHLQGKAPNDTGQPHAADGRLEEFCMLGGTAAAGLAPVVGDIEPEQVIAETAVDMMVLAVHIRRRRAAQGGETGARGDRHEPALRHRLRQHVGEAGACVGLQHADPCIEGESFPKALHGDHTLRLQGAVAIGATGTAGDHGARADGLRQILCTCGVMGDAGQDRVSAPSAQTLAAHLSETCHIKAFQKSPKSTKSLNINNHRIVAPAGQVNRFTPT